VSAGQRVTIIYQCTVMLASDRYAMVDNRMGFFLVP